MALLGMNQPPSRRPSDEVVELVLKTYRQPPWNILYTPEKARELLQKTYDSPGFYGVFDRDDRQRLTGFAVGASHVKEGQPYFRFDGLCVDPDLHGQGLGRRLTEKVIEEARKRQLAFVELNTKRTAPERQKSRAENLYAKLGFVDERVPLEHADTWRVMRLNLQDSAAPKANEEIVAASLTAFERRFKAQAISGIPELTVCAVSNERPIYLKTFLGQRQGEGRTEAALTQKVLPLGSQTKTLTAIAVLQLVEQGKLKLDDRIAAFFQELNVDSRLPFAQATIREALGHRAGLSFADQSRFIYDTDEAQRAFLAYLQEHAASIKPSPQARYANVGYILLGRLVERLSGQRFETYVQKNIVSKLSHPLYRSLEGFLPEKVMEGHRPDGQLATVVHAGQGQQAAKAFAMSSDGWFPAAGGWFGTAEAIASFYQALFDGKLLAPALVEKMKDDSAPFVYGGKPLGGVAYGLGVMRLGLEPQGQIYGHAGSWAYCRGMTVWSPETNATLSITANSAHSDGVLKTLVPLAQALLSDVAQRAVAYDVAPEKTSRRPGGAMSAGVHAPK